MRVLAICGSLQRESSNLSLLRSARDLAPSDVEVSIFTGLAELPHFDPDLEANGEIEVVGRLIAESDALLIACPEYGHSLPGSLKNAIDWVIGSGELEGKVVGVTASTASSERGRKGLRALMDTLGAVSATIVGGEPIVRGATVEIAELVGEIARVVAQAPHGD